MGISIPCKNVSGIVPYRKHNVGILLRWRARLVPRLVSMAAEYNVLSCVQRCQLGILCVGAGHTFLLQSVHTW